MKENRQSVPLTCFYGIGGGIVMAAAVLFMMRSAAFSTQLKTLIPEIAIAAALPMCMKAFSSENVNLPAAQILMVLVSFAASMIHGAYVNSESAAQSAGNLFTLPCLLHGISLAVIIIAAAIVKIKEKKEF